MNRAPDRIVLRHVGLDEQRLAAVGIDAVGSSPEAFDGYIRQEIKTWSKVVKEAGVQID